MRAALALLLASVLLAGCRDTVSGAGSTGSPGGGRTLSHAAVEKYITGALGATGVVCNDGQDFLMTTAGQTFTCTDSVQHTYTVTIKDPAAGNYEVS